MGVYTYGTCHKKVPVYARATATATGVERLRVRAWDWYRYGRRTGTGTGMDGKVYGDFVICKYGYRPH